MHWHQQIIKSNMIDVQKKGLLELSTSNAILPHNKVLTQLLEAVTAQISKLPQQLQGVQFFQSQTQPIKCDFCKGDYPNSSEAEVNYMSNQESKGVFF